VGLGKKAKQGQGGREGKGRRTNDHSLVIGYNILQLYTGTNLGCLKTSAQSTTDGKKRRILKMGVKSLKEGGMVEDIRDTKPV